MDIDGVSAVRPQSHATLRILDANQVRIGRTTEISCECQNVIARIVHRFHHLIVTVRRYCHCRVFVLHVDGEAPNLG